MGYKWPNILEILKYQGMKAAQLMLHLMKKLLTNSRFAHGLEEHVEAMGNIALGAYSMKMMTPNTTQIR